LFDSLTDRWGLLELEGRAPIEGCVLALDPGGTTGGALYYGDKIFWFQTKDMLTLWNILTKIVKPTTLVFEKFIPEVGTPWDTTALEVQGIVKLWQAQGGHVIWQYRSVVGAQSPITDNVLRHHSLWVAGAQHARDAIKHILKYLVDHGEVNWLQHLKP
jgi:hypothetical protein